jgi:hypothetical protein
MQDKQYFKKESYLRDVERWVEVIEEYDEVVGVTYNTPMTELLALGTEKYSKALDAKFNNNKMQKYSMVTLKSVYSLGILPASEILKYAKEAQEETMTIETKKGERTVLRKVNEKEEAWRDIPPTFNEMLPIARKMVKEQVKQELNEYLKLKQGLDLEHNAPDRYVLSIT